MIQRIQTIYFIVVALLFTLSFALPYVDFLTTSGSATLQYFMLNFENNNVTYFWPAALIALLTIVTTIITILKYNNRIMQIKYCYIISSLIALFYISLLGHVLMLSSLINAETIKWNPCIILPVLSLPLTLLAKRAIRADEQLVRSSERLR